MIYDICLFNSTINNLYLNFKGYLVKLIIFYVIGLKETNNLFTKLIELIR